MGFPLLAAILGADYSFLSLSVSPSSPAFLRLTGIGGILLLLGSTSGLRMPHYFFASCLTFWLTNRYIHPICPACSKDHNHFSCKTRLHGLGLPMLIALGLHAFADSLGGEHLAGALAIALHKIPEGFAMAILFRASFARPATAIAATMTIQSLTLLGSLIPHTRWAGQLDALGAGSMLFIGLHSLHSLSDRWPLLMPVGPLLEFLTHSKQSILRVRPAHQGNSHR